MIMFGSRNKIKKLKKKIIIIIINERNEKQNGLEGLIKIIPLSKRNEMKRKGIGRRVIAGIVVPVASPPAA